MRYFETRFLEAANKFLAELDRKAAAKVIYNIDLAEQSNDPRLFKKLQEEIWEFRKGYSGKQIRLLAFWDKTAKQKHLLLLHMVLSKKWIKYLRRK